MVSSTERFRMYIRKKFIMEKVVKHWKRLPRESLILDIFNRRVDVTFRNMLWWWTW